MGTTSTKNNNNKDSNNNTVLVAGSTGRLGARIVKELLVAGYQVRAGARNIEKATKYKDLAEETEALTKEQLSRLTIVPLDITDPETIIPAIGNASRIVCAVGAAESEFTDLSAPKRIDGEGTINLIEAASGSVGIDHFILVTSLGTGKWGWPAGVLNLFGGVLIFKRRAEEALERSGLRYTIVRPGGMERPTDEYKLTHNVRLAPRDTLFGGQVSRLQIAELVSSAIAYPKVAGNKCLEVVAETTAPAQSYEALLAGAEQEEDQEERVERYIARREMMVELEQAEVELERAGEELEGSREQLAAAAELAAEARVVEAEVKREQLATVKEAERLEGQLERLRGSAEQSRREADAARAVLGEAQKAQREGRVLSVQEMKGIREAILFPPQPPTVCDDDNNSGGGNDLMGTIGTLFKTVSGGKNKLKVAAVVEEEEEEEKEELGGASLSDLLSKSNSKITSFFKK